MKDVRSPSVGISINQTGPNLIADDRLEGAKAIGQFIDPSMTLREVRRLLEHGHYPSWREGRVYVASKHALLEHWREQTEQSKNRISRERNRTLVKRRSFR